MKEILEIRKKQMQIKNTNLLYAIITGIVTLSSIAFSAYIYSDARKNVYVLKNDYQLEAALVKDVNAEYSTLAKGHIRDFHELLFTLNPDVDHINEQISKAKLYIDINSFNPVYDAYKNRKFYTDIINGGWSLISYTNDVKIDMSKDPVQFLYKGYYLITRNKETIKRNLITTGYIRKIAAYNKTTEKGVLIGNDRGFLIEDWEILNDSDIE